MQTVRNLGLELYEKSLRGRKFSSNNEVIEQDKKICKRGRESLQVRLQYIYYYLRPQFAKNSW